MAEIDDLTGLILKFRDERDWEKFHSIKNLSMALSIEANEVLELSLWKTEDELSRLLSNTQSKIEFGSELADVFMYLLLLAQKTDVDLVGAVQDKIRVNGTRFPVEEFYGSFDKSKRREPEE